MSPGQRQTFLSSLSDKEATALLYDWRFWARPTQTLPDGDWPGWLLMGGRGAGKTRTGAEAVREMVERGLWGRVALVAPTAGDGRDVMVEGDSGIMRVCPPWNRPLYEPSKRRLTWPNGAIATTYSADEPERLRGPQHDGAWIDEPGTWRYPEAFDMLMLGLRLGTMPRWVATTTPRRTPLIRKLLAWPGVVITRDSTYENRDNLAPAFFDAIARQYEGTTLGRQELYAELLEDVPGALWTRALLDAHRVDKAPEQLARIVVAVDPSISDGTNEDTNEAGITVQGIDGNRNGYGYLLADLSLHTSPDGWARVAVGAYHGWNADCIVAESNQGGEMVRLTIQTVDRTVPVKLVPAKRGKYLRAQPVAALYEQGRVRHVGAFAQLEDQQCSWLPGDDSPDRLDALVHGFTELMLDKREPQKQPEWLR